MDIPEVKSTVDTQKSLSDIGLESIFKGSGFFVFLYKKTERILQALYLVTNFLKDEEPLKWHLRKKGGNLLSDILIIYTLKKELNSKKVKAQIIEIISFLEVSENSNLVSKMNSLIIKNELALILKTIDSHDLKNEAIFSGNFFEAGLMPHAIEKEKEEVGEDYEDSTVSKGHSKRHDMSFRNILEIKGHIKDRKEFILSIVRKNKEVTINDICLIIKDCSEKTIQRELQFLIGNGVLKKVGERRWSRYQLA